ncbi:MAG: hypothetical protein O3A51_08885 [Verrucomicrobia bacterium]|nr:hypothetical protein [Verrucomicrobiota bacterium]
MARQARPAVVEPEVLPPEDESPAAKGGRLRRQFSAAFGPIIAGVIIDSMDFLTFGRFGLMLGMLLGGSAAYWITSAYRLPIWQRLLWSTVTGIYCTLPRTEFIPVATLIGACARFWQAGRAHA